MLEVNPIQLIAAIKQGQNPQQLIMNILEGRMSNTPLGQNLLQMAKNNDTKGIEQVVRNLSKQQGVDFDTEFAAFCKMLGIRQ